MKILNQTQGTVVAEQAMLADTILSRLVGLLGRDEIRPQEALVITHCRSIHMLFMRFAIDVIFLDRDNRAVGLVRNIRPFRFSPYFLRAVSAIELPPGSIDRSRTQKGDTLSISK